MSKTKTVNMDASQPVKEEKKKKVKKKDATPQEEGGVVESKGQTETAPRELGISKTQRQAKAKKNTERVRGKKYQEAKAKVESDKTYSPEEAVRLAQETSIASFGGPIELHVVLIRGTVNKVLDLPYAAGRAKKVEIASDDTVKNLQAGKIEFDVLIAHPSMMPKLVPFARLLGPRGMMPNPKNGTVSTNVEEAAAKFGGNSLQVKSEAKAPLIHTVIGKVGQPEKELLENFQVIVGAIGAKNIEKSYLTATMGPSIRVAVI